jgi:hypothetical protein
MKKQLLRDTKGIFWVHRAGLLAGLAFCLACAGCDVSGLVSGVQKAVLAATPITAPTFSPSAGTYSGNQTVVFSCATTGATIYYTTDGSTPTTASAVYSSPIMVAINGSSETIKAIAVSSGGARSAVAVASYTITSGQPLFLFAGSVQTTSPSLTLPAYWKNGVFSLLPTGSQTNGVARSIMIVKNSVYIDGYTEDGSTATTMTPVYWKDGALVTLSTGLGAYGEARGGMAITSDGDVYIAGDVTDVTDSTSFTYPVYWKNGIPYSLPLLKGTLYGGQANSCFVAPGTDTPVFYGYVNDSTGYPQPVYWSGVNGNTATVNELHHGTADTTAVGGEMEDIQEVTISGTTTTYFLGEDEDQYWDPLVPDIWVNGNLVRQLPTGASSYGSCWGIFSPNGSDIYITGITGSWINSSTQPAYWFNYALESLPMGGAFSGYAGGIVFINGDFYINGVVTDASGYSKPVYWKNGITMYTLPYPLTYMGGDASGSFCMSPG